MINDMNAMSDWHGLIVHSIHSCIAIAHLHSSSFFLSLCLSFIFFPPSFLSLSLSLSLLPFLLVLSFLCFIHYIFSFANACRQGQPLLQYRPAHANNYACDYPSDESQDFCGTWTLACGEGTRRSTEMKYGITGACMCTYSMCVRERERVCVCVCLCEGIACMSTCSIQSDYNFMRCHILGWRSHSVLSGPPLV